MKTLKISENTHTELTKVKGQIMAQTGNPDLTYDEVIGALIQNWKTTREGVGEFAGGP